jgi:hypothetical protein
MYAIRSMAGLALAQLCLLLATMPKIRGVILTYCPGMVSHTLIQGVRYASALATCDNAKNQGRDSHLLPGNGFAHLDTRGKICVRASRVSTGNDLHAGENVIHQSEAVPDCNKYRTLRTTVDLVN